MSKVVGRKVLGPVREDGETGHFITCECGELLDMRRLDVVLEHEELCLGPPSPAYREEP